MQWLFEARFCTPFAMLSTRPFSIVFLTCSSECSGVIRQRKMPYGDTNKKRFHSNADIMEDSDDEKEQDTKMVKLDESRPFYSEQYREKHSQVDQLILQVRNSNKRDNSLLKRKQKPMKEWISEIQQKLHLIGNQEIQQQLIVQFEMILDAVDRETLLKSYFVELAILISSISTNVTNPELKQAVLRIMEKAEHLGSQ